MSDDPLPTLIASLPFLEALLAAHHELRMPLVSMRAALQLIERFCASAELEALIQPLLAQVNRLYDHLDRLFELRALVATPSQSSTPKLTHQASANQPIELLKTIIAQLREDTAVLHQLILPPQAIDSTSLTQDTQKLFAIFLTNQERWNRGSVSMLDVMLNRLQDGEQN